MNTLRLLCLLGTLIALAGCAGGGDATSLFLLDQSYPPTGEQRAGTAQPMLIVEPVSVAPYLDASGIAYQTAPYRVTVANNSRWASPLPDQLTDGLYAALSGELDAVALVRGHPSGRGPALRLKTRVDEFMGHFDGTAHVAGQWTLIDPNGRRIAQQQFEQRVPLDADGYPALVASLSRGWRQISEMVGPAVAAALRQSDISR